MGVRTRDQKVDLINNDSVDKILVNRSDKFSISLHNGQNLVPGQKSYLCVEAFTCNL